jgi:hypothetical protein
MLIYISDRNIGRTVSDWTWEASSWLQADQHLEPQDDDAKDDDAGK